MTRFWKISICLLLVCFGLTACSEEGADERDIPAVFTVVSKMYNAFASKTSCEDINAQLSNSQLFNRNEVSEACLEYQERRNSNGGYESLASDKTNSGYYQAAFILADQLYTKAKQCTETRAVTRNTLKNTFDALSGNQCEQFIQDAKTFTSKRGN